MEGNQNGPTDTQVATLADTIKDLVGVVKELKQELSDQREEIKSLRAEKKRKTLRSTKSAASTAAIPPPPPPPPQTRFPFGGLDLDAIDAITEGSATFSDLLNGTSSFYGGPQRSANADQSFHLFSKLPPELRMRIWKMALPAGRLFEPYFDAPHRINAAGGANGANVVTLNFGPVGMGMAGPLPGPNGPAPAANAAGGQAAPTPRPDPPVIRLSSFYPPPRIRAVCREARIATFEAGAFEFGLFKTGRRGYWFNHSADVVKLATESTQLSLLQYIDLSRVQRIAFNHTQFKTEASCTAILDLILAHAPRCRKVMLFYDQDARYTYRHPPSSKANFWELRDDDVVGNHAFPVTRGVSPSPIRWSDLHRVVTTLWREHMASQNLEPNGAPEFLGMDLYRPSRLY